MNSESAKLSAVVLEVGPGQDPAEELKQFEEDDRREQHTLPQRSSLRNLHSRQHRVSFTLQLAPISNLLTMKTLAVCCNKSLPPFVFRGCLLSQEPHSDRYSRYAQRREEV